MDLYSNSEETQLRLRAAEEVNALRAKVGRLERRLRDESHLRQSLRAQLARRQDFLARLTQAMPAALFVHSLATGADTFLNDYLGTALGYPAAPAPKPRALATLLHPHEQAAFARCQNQLRLAPVGAQAQLTARLRGSAGGWHWCRLHLTVARCNSLGQATHLVGVLAAEEPVAHQANQLADISHELKTPLHAIVGLAQLLHQSPGGPAQADYLEALLANTEHLLGLAASVLAPAAPAEQPFDAVATVRRVVQSLAFTAQAQGIALQLELPASPLPPVVGQAGHLSQVLLNLLSNALKFTAAGSITVALVPGPSVEGRLELELCVADTGIGIAPEQATRVFERYAQASPDIAPRFGGTGLGLAICHEVVTRQGGRIWLESTLGQGSRFYFVLPYRLSEQVVATPSAQPPAATPLPGLRVLLVDDNEAGALLARSLLQTWQVATEVAPDGERALVLALSQPYDLILMDLQLPRLSGLAATDYLRSHAGPNQATPIVALTADASAAGTDLLTAGFAGWLEKPYAAAQLYQALCYYTGRKLAPAPPDGLLYGFEGLGRLAHDPHFISKMQRLFIETAPVRLAQLEATLAQQDWVAAQPLVHSLKTTYGSLQIEEALQPLRKIENLLQHQPTYAALASLLHAVRLATDKTTKVFETQLNN